MNGIDRAARSYRVRELRINYAKKVSVPIRDMTRDGEVVFVVDVYGVEPEDLCVVPGGGAPMYRAVTRLGLDPMRFQAFMWDVPVRREK